MQRHTEIPESESNKQNGNKRGEHRRKVLGRLWKPAGPLTGSCAASQEERAREAADRQTAGQWSMKDKGGKGNI